MTERRREDFFLLNAPVIALIPADDLICAIFAGYGKRVENAAMQRY